MGSNVSAFVISKHHGGSLIMCLELINTYKMLLAEASRPRTGCDDNLWRCV